MADPRGAPPSTDQNFLNFMQFLGKSGKFVCWRPPRGLAPPPTENPVSAPGNKRSVVHFLLVFLSHILSICQIKSIFKKIIILICYSLRTD